MSPAAQLYEKIGLIEKSWLNQSNLENPGHLYGILDDFTFYQIHGGRVIFEKKEELFHLINFDPNFISALFNQSIPLIYILQVNNGRVNLFFGTSESNAEVLAGLLEANIGSRLLKRTSDVKGFCQTRGAEWAALTGMPLTEQFKKKQDIGYSRTKNGIDFLISGLIKQNWCYIVQAFPINRGQIQKWVEACGNEIKEIKVKSLLTDIQKSDRVATYYVDILEKSLSRLKSGMLNGIWQTGVYLLADSSESRDRGRALLSTVFSGSKTGPEPIRTHKCSALGDCSPFINSYNSNELNAFITLPEYEYPGYRLHEHVMFDVDFSDSDYFQVVVGKITDDRHVYEQDCAISLNDLTKHTTVAGVTGSGKTNTVFHILLQLYRKHQIPFLIIEPAKSEYRNLLNQIEELQIFTLGEERPGISSPFRFNPFAFDPGVSIQTHLDYLKAVFHASFVMYAPMPYILEECLYKIYEDKGWNLVTSTNFRGRTDIAFPTLKDLYYKIDEVVDNIGYDDRLTMDIKSALKTRIKNLCIGGKGRMLNTASTISIKTIMQAPTVLELKYMGNDEEKAFMMGLILTAIGEYYDAQQDIKENDNKGRLRHLTVIEEAHRLLKNVPTEKVSEDLNNTKGKGVETFTNLLAEIREYGEGIIVAEQIPVKLAPEVMKNSNLKIMHRIVATEDRDVMGGTMNLDERQKRHAATLNAKEGEAIFFREGLDRPIKISVPLSDVKRSSSRVTGKQIHDKMLQLFYSRNPNLLELMPACRACPNVNTERCEQIRLHKDMTQIFIDGESISIKIFLPFILDPGKKDPHKHIYTVLDANSPTYYCALAHLIDTYICAKGNYFDWLYVEQDGLREKAHAAILDGKFTNYIGEYCHKNNKAGASTICSMKCFHQCRFGFEISNLVRDQHLHNQFLRILDSSGTGPELYMQLNNLFDDFFQEIIPTEQMEYIRDLSICYMIQKLKEQHFPIPQQKRIIDSFIQNIL